MSAQKKRAAPAATGTTHLTILANKSISLPPGDCQGVAGLIALNCAGVPQRQMVSGIRAVYPKHDKVLFSKCLRPEQYGIALLPEAVSLAYAAAGADKPPRARKRPPENRSKPCRIYGRLDRSVFAALQQALKEDGIPTVQDWICKAVRRYLTERKKTKSVGKNKF